MTTRLSLGSAAITFGLAMMLPASTAAATWSVPLKLSGTTSAYARDLVVAGSTAVAMYSEGDATYRPDGWVRYYSVHADGQPAHIDPSAWKGDDIYNTTARYQTAKMQIGGSALPSLYWVFQVTIENDGSTDRFRVQATGTDTTVRYYRGKTKITSDVVDGTYRTPYLGHGETLVLKAKVWPSFGVDTVRLVTITSIGNPTKTDTVRIKVTYTGCGC